MPGSHKRWWILGLALLVGTQTAFGQLFEADSKRGGHSKMDIVVKEIERRDRSSIMEITITKVGSSVGSSFFLLCSLRQLAQLRGPYRYIVKIEETPKPGQMLVGFLRAPEESLSAIDTGFAGNHPRLTVIDLDQFAPICDLPKQ
ncbi:MAG: hypothetical protein HZB35_00780 [Nitrospirae bacterium]|nr:hypothetical protein [Nitrospirota bacterium]